MTVVSTLKVWWNARRHLPLDEMLSVEFDEAGVRTRVLAKLDQSWNQSFNWSEISRVCFKSDGLQGSDSIIVQLRQRDKTVVIPIDARGGSTCCGTLCERGYFPGEIWRKAAGDTTGGTHCWPPENK